MPNTKVEMLDVYNSRGFKVGVIDRKEAHKKNAGVFHKAVHIWIVNEEGKLLIQQRAACKATCPNMWDISAAGHVEEGERLLTTCVRETFEEIGIMVPEKDFIYVGELVHKELWEFTEQFIVRINAKIEDMTLQKEEVQQVKWIDIPSFKKLLYTDNFMDHSYTYKFFMHRFLSKHFGE